MLCTREEVLLVIDKFPFMAMYMRLKSFLRTVYCELQPIVYCARVQSLADMLFCEHIRRIRRLGSKSFSCNP